MLHLRNEVQKLTPWLKTLPRLKGFVVSVTFKMVFFFQFVCSMVNVKNLRLRTFAQSVIKASDRHVPLFSRKWRRLPSWSLEQRRRQKKAPLDGSFYLDVHESVVAKVIVDPSWPHFQHPRPARITSPRLPLGILCRALTTRPSHWPRPQQNPSHSLSLLRTYALASSFWPEIALQLRR